MQIYELPPSENTGTGGIEVAILETSTQLVKLGHEVCILTGAKDIPTEQSINGVKICTIDSFGLMRRTWKGSNLSFVRQLLFPLVVILNKKQKYDVYHGHIYASGFIAVYLSRRTNSIAVNTIHGSYYPIWNKLTNPLYAFFYKKCERILAPMIAKLSDIQLHTGDYFAQQVVLWGAPKEKVKTLYNGVDIDRFNPSNYNHNDIEQLKKKLLLNAEIPTIITARRLVKKNGIEYLIKAFKLVLDKKDAQLIIIGEGSEYLYLKKLIINFNIQHRVHLLGFIPNSEMPLYISIADISIIPSLMEASSIFMFECMAMEKAVIATKTGGLKEILDSSIGILVEPASIQELNEAITELIDNRGKRNLFAKNGRNYVKKYNSSTIITKELESIYDSINLQKSRFNSH